MEAQLSIPVIQQARIPAEVLAPLVRRGNP
jgi:hypothetical protein